jgi:metal-sulfur cluster biosynthetic enzyme
MKQVSVEEVWNSLKTVYDPCCADRGISVVDMGVAEDVSIDPDGTINVKLVLTTGWCPFVSSMEDAIPAKLKEDFGVEKVKVESVWDPVWTTDRLSTFAKEKLSMPLEQLLPLREARIKQEQEKANQESEVAV